MQKTNIEWTDLSANPLKYRRKSDGKVVWGCVKTSTGCAHCYSEALALRYDRGKLFNSANMEELEPILDEADLHKMLTAKLCGGVQVSGSRCFVGDMTDLFGPWVSDEMLDRLFAYFAMRPDVTWQLLTKRAERMRNYLTREYGPNGRPGDNNWCEDAPRALCKLSAIAQYIWERKPYLPCYQWPLPNVHLGVSVENQKYADERIPFLLQTPAAVRFLSCEPLLSAIDLSAYFGGEYATVMGSEPNYNFGIGWVVCGGESGPGARPMNLAHARSLRDQCKASGIPFFFKQIDKKQPIPADLMIREFPVVNAAKSARFEFGQTPAIRR